MSENGDYESKLWRTLEKERLADLSQYHRSDYFDEVPFYSRNADVSFLLRLGVAQADKVLLGFGVKFLRALVNYEIPQRPFFAALTVWNNPEVRFLVPHLFVCSGTVKERLNRLELHKPENADSRRIKRLVAQLSIQEPFLVLEDRSTTPDMTRVFIGYQKPPYSNFVSLQTFVRKEVSSP